MVDYHNDVGRLSGDFLTKSLSIWAIMARDKRDSPELLTGWAAYKKCRLTGRMIPRLTQITWL